MIRRSVGGRIAAFALLLIAGCGGGHGSIPSLSPPAGGGSSGFDPRPWLAQSRNPDVNPDTPLRASDPITYRRLDWDTDGPGGQAETSFQAADGSFITSWQYTPFAAFATDARGYGLAGDGGEQYVVTGGTATIVRTQDGGEPGVQTFPVPWTIIMPGEVECSSGWSQFNAFERGCHAVISFPVSGLDAGTYSADTYVSEHNTGPGTPTERIFFVKGGGRWLWQACLPSGPVVAAVRAPDFGWNTCPYNEILVDERLNTNFVPVDTGLTPAQLWHP